MTISEGYFNDLMNQPRALRDTLAGLREQAVAAELVDRLRSGQFRRVVLTGMGSSYHVFHPLQQALVRRGLDAFLVETSELLHSLPDLLQPTTLVITVSQSGRSAETLSLLDQRAERRFTVLGVTNTAGSPLAEQADASILTRAGEENNVSCKTYVASLAALAWLEAALAGEPVEPVLDEMAAAVPAVEAYLAEMDAHIKYLKGQMDGASDLFLVGRGRSLAAVGTGGLINKEAAHFHSEGMSSAAFRHGPFELLNPNIFVLVYEGEGRAAELNRRLYEDVLAAGARAGLVSENADAAAFRLARVPASARPVLEILPVQMMTLAISALHGHEAGTFSLNTKVTTVE